jgi:hypothetical protein
MGVLREYEEISFYFIYSFTVHSVLKYLGFKLHRRFRETLSVFLEYHISMGEFRDASSSADINVIVAAFPPATFNRIIEVLLTSHSFNFSDVLRQRDLSMIWRILLKWILKKEDMK